MRLFTWLIAAVTVSVAAVALAAFFAIGNPAASAWIIRQAITFAPGHIVIDGISGDLVSGIRLGSVRYELPAAKITARNAAIRVGWLELIEGRLVFHRVAATELHVEFIADDISARDDTLPEIRAPIGIHVNQLQLGQFNLRAGEFDETLTGVTAQLRLENYRLDINLFKTARNDLRLSLTGQLDFIDAYPLMARVNWQMADSQLSGSGRFSGDLRTLDFEHVLRVPVVVNVSGRLADLTRKPTIEATANWANLVWTSEQGAAIASSGGQARLEGGADRFMARVQGDLSLPSIPGLRIDIEAAGDLAQLEITRLDVAGFGGSLTGEGRVAVGEQRIILQLTGTDLDPGTIRPDLPGRLDAKAAVELQIPDRFDIDIESVRGEFLGQQLNGRARIRSAAEQWSITDMQVDAGDNRLRFDGVLLPSLRGKFRIDANDLSTVWPELLGQLNGRGEIEGSLTDPLGRIELQAGQLFYRDQGFENLQIEGRIDSSRRIQLTLDAQGLSSGNLSLGDLDARTSGTLDAQQVQLELTGGAVDVSITAEGGWDGKAARFSVSSGSIDNEFAGEWRLDKPFALQATAANVQFGAHCWIQAPARLCAQDGRFGDAATRIAGTLTSFPLVAVQQWLGEDFSVHGTADAEFALLREAERPIEGRIKWRQRSTRIDYRDSPKSIVSMTIDTVDFDVAAGNERTDITGKIRTNFGIAIDVDARTSPLIDRDATIAGRVQLTVPDIAETLPLLNRFVDIDRAGGRVDADLKVSGTIAAPRIQGNARLADGSVYIYQTGIDIEDIQLSLSGSDDSPVDVTGSARSGDGELQVAGKLDYSDSSGAYADLSIEGEMFQVIRLPGQTADISPKLTAHIDDRQIALTGAVQIPRAEIVVESLPESAAVPSADAVVEATIPQKATRRTPVEFVGEIDLVLGDNVRFAGFGIDTRLVGGLKLSRSAGAVGPVTEGNLRTVDGEFNAYRKQLDIERGTLIFVGSLTDPNLDVRAVRNLTYEGRPITVGVLLTGRLSAIQTRLFSQPAMSEADALSYLVLDRPLRQAEDSDSADLSGAALALGISQAMPVTQQIGENLGLDEVAIEGSNEDTTALVAGRRIGDDVYIRYSYGLFNRIGTFIIRYDLRGGISVEAGSGEEQTLDLIFTIRR